MTKVDLSVYGIVDASVSGRDTLVEKARDAVAGGITLLQYRDKDGGTAAMIDVARGLKQVLAGSNVPLLINDRIDVALAAGADGVHVGQEDMAPADVRRLLGPDAIIGLTIKNRSDVDSMPLDLVDYACIGGVFATTSKKNPAPPVGLEGFAMLAGLLRARGYDRPIGAIAGIGANNAADVIGAGADGVAVISALFSADDIRAATADLAGIVAKALHNRENAA